VCDVGIYLRLIKPGLFQELKWRRGYTYQNRKFKFKKQLQIQSIPNNNIQGIPNNNICHHNRRQIWAK